MADGLKRERDPRGRWVPRERMHLTLLFVGDFPASDLGMVVHALAAGDHLRAPAVDLVLDSASSFPGRRPPWVLRCDRSRAALLPMHDALADALAADGFAVRREPDFVPHVTLLRHASEPLAPVAIPPIAWRVREFALVRSRAGATVEYRVLRRWPLADDVAVPAVAV